MPAAGDDMRPLAPAGIRVLACSLVLACSGDADGPGDDPPPVDRLAAIPAGAVKGTPANDEHPPILHSSEFHEPAAVPVISTAGAEDAPFIPEGSDELYFFFAADARQDASMQIRDPVNGIWVSHTSGTSWTEPALVWLQKRGTLALNGCPFVHGDELIFCSARDGYSGVNWFRATRVAGTWRDWMTLSFPGAV